MHVLRNGRSWSDGNGNGNGIVLLAPLTNNKPSTDGCSTVVLKWDGRIGLHGLVWMDGMVSGWDEVSSNNIFNVQQIYGGCCLEIHILQIWSFYTFETNHRWR